MTADLVQFAEWCAARAEACASDVRASCGGDAVARAYAAARADDARRGAQAAARLARASAVACRMAAEAGDDVACAAHATTAAAHAARAAFYAAGYSAVARDIEIEMARAWAAALTAQDRERAEEQAH